MSECYSLLSLSASLPPPLSVSHLSLSHLWAMSASPCQPWQALRATSAIQCRAQLWGSLRARRLISVAPSTPRPTPL